MDPSCENNFELCKNSEFENIKELFGITRMMIEGNSEIFPANVASSLWEKLDGGPLARMFGIERASRFSAHQWELRFRRKVLQSVCAGRDEIVGSSRVGPRCAVCMADFVAVRWTSLPPFSEDRAACTVCHVRELTTLEYGQLLRHCWGGSPEAWSKKTWQDVSQLCQCASEASVFGSATRMAPAACWASWADDFPMISARLPSLGEEILEAKTGEQAKGCIEELVSAAGQLDRGGFCNDHIGCSCEQEPAHQWLLMPQHGWQFHASSPLEHHFRETVLLARPCPDDQVAHSRSHSGPGSSCVLCGAPSTRIRPTSLPRPRDGEIAPPT